MSPAPSVQLPGDFGERLLPAEGEAETQKDKAHRQPQVKDTEPVGQGGIDGRDDFFRRLGPNEGWQSHQENDQDGRNENAQLGAEINPGWRLNARGTLRSFFKLMSLAWPRSIRRSAGKRASTFRRVRISPAHSGSRRRCTAIRISSGRFRTNGSPKITLR